LGQGPKETLYDLGCLIIVLDDYHAINFIYSYLHWRESMHNTRVKLVLFGTLLFVFAVVSTPSAQAGSDSQSDNRLSTIWPYEIKLWSQEIEQVGQRYGVDPNLIAAIVLAESAGDAESVSYVGAVGLMGIMPQSPDFPGRPETDELTDAVTNLNWGVAILTSILQQSGGDIHSAMAAYNGGWDLVDHPVPQGYSHKVLDFYGKAVAGRAGVVPEIATRWTIGVDIRNGHIPQQSLLLGNNNIENPTLYGEHIVYNGVDANKRTYFIRGFAVPAEVVAAPEKYDQLSEGR
jgi:hypothetical protein